MWKHWGYQSLVSFWMNGEKEDDRGYYYAYVYVMDQGGWQREIGLLEVDDDTLLFPKELT